MYKVDMEEEWEVGCVLGMRRMGRLVLMGVKGKGCVEMGGMEKEDLEEGIDKMKIK